MKFDITKCPHCGNFSFKYLSDDGKRPNHFKMSIEPYQKGAPGGMTLGGPYIPSLIKMCESCGYIGLFSAMIADK